MSMEKNLKEFLEELIQEVEKELDEATATGAVAGYQTPMAFSDKGKSDKKRKKKIATSMGYSVVGNDVDNISEASDSEIKKSIKKNERGGPYTIMVRHGNYNKKIVDHSPKSYDKVEDAIKMYHKYNKKHKGRGVSIEDSYGRTVFMESVNEVKVNYNFSEEELKRVLKLLGRNASTEVKMIKAFEKAFGRKLTRDELFESVNEDKFYNTRVQYTDPKSKKKFVGDVVRKDGDEYKVNLGKDGRFEKYILAKAKDLKIVSKSKKRTYESVNESKVKRPVNRWLELKNDESMHPHKKMAMGLKELKYQLRETEKFFNWYNKIKTMNELDSNQYWKRTNKHIYSIKEKLINIAKTIQEIEK